MMAPEECSPFAGHGSAAFREVAWPLPCSWRCEPRENKNTLIPMPAIGPKPYLKNGENGIGAGESGAKDAR